MRCKAVRNQLDRLIGQELAPRTRERVEAHLSVCPECRRHLAEEKQLLSLLRSLPQPPEVPAGFGDRLMEAARGRQAAHRPAPGTVGRRAWSRWSSALSVRNAVQALAIAGGLLIGVLLGQQTWRSAHRPIVPPGAEANPLAVYELDYLTDAPGGSLAQSFLSLTNASNHHGT